MPILQPSFRGRLRLFFAVIVVVPMIAVAIVLFQLLGANDTGKINSRLAEAQVAATGLFNESRDEARAAGPMAESSGDPGAAVRAMSSRRTCPTSWTRATGRSAA